MGKVLDFSSCFKGELFALTFCILTMIYQNVYFLIFILLVFSELSESMSSFSSWPLLFQIFPLLHSLFFLSFWYSNCVCLTFWNGPTVIECSYFFFLLFLFPLHFSLRSFNCHILKLSDSFFIHVHPTDESIEVILH